MIFIIDGYFPSKMEISRLCYASQEQICYTISKLVKKKMKKKKQQQNLTMNKNTLAAERKCLSWMDMFLFLFLSFSDSRYMKCERWSFWKYATS